MGWLAPDLYAAYRNFGNHCGDSRPAWDDLDASERYRWEAVWLHVSDEISRMCHESRIEEREAARRKTLWQSFKGFVEGTT